MHRHSLRFMLFPLALASTLLSGCISTTGVEMTAIPARIDYICAEKRILPVVRAPQTGMAAVIVNNQEILLRGGISAAQEKYSDGNYTLYLEGENAMLEQNGRVLFGPCTSPVPLPIYYRDR